jgi:flagellar basal body L-ring protein FlgH
MRSYKFLALAVAYLLAACSGEDNQASMSGGAGAAEATQAPEAQGTVARQTSAPAAPAPVPVAALQTQAGPAGMQVALVRAQVTGDILTVQLSATGPDENYKSEDLDIAQVNVVDDAAAQRYGVLRDAENRWQASPIPSNNADVVRVTVHQSQPSVVWFKFPAPPPTSKTLSINIPEVGPFLGVRVQR